MKHRQNQGGWVEILGGFIVVAVVIALIAVAIWSGIYFSTNHHNRTFTITDKQVVAVKDGHKYLIYTDNGVYQDTDSMLNGKYNSSDMYGQLKVGQKYSCDVVGYRNGFWSAYENLINCNKA